MQSPEPQEQGGWCEGTRGPVCHLLAEGFTEDRRAKRHHRRHTSAPNTERTFPNTTCVIMTTMLWGKRSAAREPGQSPPVTCNMGTQNLRTGRKHRGTRHTQRGCVIKPRVQHGCLEVGHATSSSAGSTILLPPSHGRWVTTKGLGQILA